MKKSDSFNQPSTAVVVVSCCFALIAFAANSVLCRLALRDELIDPVSFTQIRIVSGALTLLIILACQNQGLTTLFKDKYLFYSTKSWIAPCMLFAYAIFFSFAYIELSTATGALVLFGSVQLCMLGSQFLFGKALSAIEWLGIVFSMVGFVYLLLPGSTMPSPIGFVLMFIAGCAWAIYTLLGKKANQPVAATTRNFVLTIPFCLLLLTLQLSSFHLTLEGALLAIASGAFASGVGYSIWYFAVRYLSVASAAVGQLSVPLIAAAGGVLIVDEPLTYRLVLGGGLILSGIGLTIHASLRRT